MTDSTKPAEQFDLFLEAERLRLTPTLGQRSTEVIVQGALLLHSVIGAASILSMTGVSQTRRFQLVGELLHVTVEKLNTLVMTAAMPEQAVVEAMGEEQLKAGIQEMQDVLNGVVRNLTKEMERLDAAEVSGTSKIILPPGVH
jgi:hypothetical protein